MTSATKQVQHAEPTASALGFRPVKRSGRKGSCNWSKPPGPDEQRTFSISNHIFLQLEWHLCLGLVVTHRLCSLPSFPTPHGVLSWLLCADSHSRCVSDSYFRGKRDTVAPHRDDNSWPCKSLPPKNGCKKLCNSYYEHRSRFVRLVEHFALCRSNGQNQMTRKREGRTTPLSPSSSSSSPSSPSPHHINKSLPSGFPHTKSQENPSSKGKEVDNSN